MTSTPGESKNPSPDALPLPWPSLQRKLEENADWNRDLFEHSRDLLCIHDLQGRLLSINPVPARLLGYSVDALLRIPMQDLVPAEFRPQFDDYLRKIARDGEAHGLLAVLTRSGERRIWEYHNSLRTEGVSQPLVRGMGHDVTEQKRIERELRKNEERYRSVITAMAEGVIVMEADGRLIASNPSAEQILGVKPEELAGAIANVKEEWGRYTIHEDGSPFLAKDYPATITLQTGKPQTNVCVGVVRPNDEVRWLLVNSQPLHRQPEDKPSAVVITFTDFTEHRRAKEALRVNEERLRLAQIAARVGTFERNLTTGENRWTPELEQLYGLAPGESPQSLEAFLNLVHPGDRAKVQNCVEESVKTGEGHGEWRRVWPDGSVHWIAGRWRVFVGRDGRPERLIGIDRDITDRKRIEVALRESEAELREAQRVALMGNWRFDLMTQTVTASEQLYSILGREPDAAGVPFGELARFFPPESWQVIFESNQKALQTGQSEEIEVSFLRPESTIGTILVRGQSDTDEHGNIIGLHGIAIDITERKRAEEELRRSEQRYRSLAEATTQVVWMMEAGEDAVDLATWTEFTGQSKEEARGDGWLAGVHPDDREATRMAWAEAVKNGSVYERAHRVRRRDGAYRLLSVRGVPVRGKDGRIHEWIGTCSDITEQKRIEDELRAGEEFIAQAQDAAHLGCFEWDLRTNRLVWSPEQQALYGMAPGTFTGRYEDFLAMVLPDDLEKAFASIKGKQTGDETAVEFRIRHQQTGEVRWIGARGKLFGDVTGTPARMIGINMDITDRKRAEEALRQSEERFRVALKNSPITVFNQDRDLRYTWMYNPQLPRPAISHLGKTPREFYGPEDGEPLMKTRRQVLDTGVGTRHEVRLPGTDGRMHYFDTTIEPVVDANGNVTGLTGASAEITERKMVEDSLRESEQLFRLFVEHAPAGLAMFDREMRYLHYSERWRTDYGLSDGDLRGISHYKLFPDLPERWKEIHRRCLSGEVIREESDRFDRLNGSTQWLCWEVRPWHDKTGAVGGIVIFSEDITERRRIEEELRQAKERLTEENLYLEQQIDTELGFHDIIGQSKALKAVMESVAKVATSDATVLLLGETGTGKELVARAIHRLSLRAGSAFIKTNCAAIPSGLLESELFGHERGAFTGAVTKKIGRLELADKGTLFLDEIGEISLELQPKLLRVLQDQEFERLGGTQTLKVDCRLIAATNRNLAAEVRENAFRSDLYYRLNVFPIQLPPLRERRDDIPLLVEHFVQKIARRMNKSITSIPKRTMETLVGWDWPGNIRELENFVERSVILSQGSVLAAPLRELQPPAVTHDQIETLEDAEREHILRALRESRGQISGVRGAAARLGLKRTTLQSKLKQMGIDRKGLPPAN